MNVISLFAGCGGSSTGYRLAGCRVLAASEFVPAAIETYRANYPDTRIFDGDVRELRGGAILDALGLRVGELDILDGSPPCSSFSMAGKREKGWGQSKYYSEGIRQRTDDLFFEYSRLVGELMPRYFVAENVPGLATGGARNILGSQQRGLFESDTEPTIYEALRGHGYRVSHRVLNAADYGVPQTRRRLFIVGVRNDLGRSPKFPRRSVSRYTTLGEAFAGIVNSPKELADVNIERYEIYKRLRELPPDISKITKYESDTGSYFSLVRASPDHPCPTITATASDLSAASVCHWDNRKFTVPELKAIQSFPRDYKLTGAYKQQAERIGRAVPPLLTKAIAEAILSQEGKR